jgi:hypothetical protein
MFSSTILDVGVGLIFAFLAVSLVSSAVTESLASAFKWRSATLLDGIKSLLNDDGFTGLARDIYNHALINPRGDGQAAGQTDIKLAPAYIDPKLFAKALTDVLAIAPLTPEAMKAALATKLPKPQLNRLLSGIIDRTGGNLSAIHGELAAWFDSAMDRVGGAYKRKTQIVSFIIGLMLAVVLNVDAISVAQALWQQPVLTKSIEAKVGDTAQQELAKLDALKLPIGWTDEKQFEQIRGNFAGAKLGAWVAVLGWLITAVATLFGAPFWFDALQRIVRLKGSGPSPAEKATDSSAAA